jgi:hypothetical protein
MIGAESLSGERWTPWRSRSRRQAEAAD